MIMKKYFILAAAVAMFTACTNNDDITQQSPTENERIPLTIGMITGNVNVTSTTRSSTITLQDNEAVNQTANTAGMGLYIMKQGEIYAPEAKVTPDPAVDYDVFNIQSTSLNNGTPSPTYTQFVKSATSFYYPDVKTQGVDIYIYSPWNTNAPDCSTNAKGLDQTFALSTSTTQTYDADYYANDFLWGCIGAGITATASTNGGTNTAITAANYKLAKSGTATTGFVTSSGEVIVPLVHLGSKIIVNVKPGTGMTYDKLTGAKVYFGVDYTGGTLMIRDGAIATSGAASRSFIEIGHLGYSDNTPTAIASSDWDVNGTKGVIWEDKNLDGNKDAGEIGGYTCAGVILPQTVNTAAVGDGPLIKITLSDAATTYIYKPATSPTFSRAKKYVYTITVNASGIVVTTSVKDWTNDTSSLVNNGVGTAELE